MSDKKKAKKPAKKARKKKQAPGADVTDWWTTSIIDMAPNRISIRGHEIEKLIGTMSFPQMVWLMTTGELITGWREMLLESALVAAVDHGPQAPAVAAARMAISCGVGINNALASGVNMLGDVHGGAGEQAVELFTDIADRLDAGDDPNQALLDALADWRETRGKFIPGYGHRFHKQQDPRSPRLLELVDRAVEEEAVSGRFAEIGRAVEDALAAEKGVPLPMNIDGATAVIYAELGCPPMLARGLFCLSRSVGILAHSYEQAGEGARNKGPTPPGYGWKYTGERK